MSPVPSGSFVRSSANDLGIGKLVAVRRGTAEVTYFSGPGYPLQSETVPADSVRAVALECETRVYHPRPGGAGWRAGRALAPHGANYLVRFPNDTTPEQVPAVELFARCDRPLPDPALFLAARVTETPHWQQLRARFVRAVIDQRRACAGLTALLSSCIELEPHQIEVVRRVLQDPVQRYLLADEVGLGKTIEAGVILRQYVLDRPADHAALVLVPPHLVRQWEGELTNRFRLGPLLGETVHVLPHDASDLDGYPGVGLVVIDEAHQVTRWAGSTNPTERKRFDALRARVGTPGLKLLLLSATPTLHSNESGFQALLHLLDPVVYPLGDIAGFRARLGQHERVARLYHLFRPTEEGGYLEGALDQLAEAFPTDARLAALADELRPHLAYGADPEAPRREELIRAVRSHVSEAYRLHRRLLRNRRTDERVDGLLPGRVGLKRWIYEDPATPRLAALLDEWRTAASAETAHAADYGRLLVMFAEALACDPAALAALIQVRLGAAPAFKLLHSARELLTNVPRFEDENTLLARLRDAATATSAAPRLSALLTELEALFLAPKTRVTRAVVFASYPAVADAVCAALSARWPGKVLRHGANGWQHFRTGPDFRALVCDSAAEEGLNLHARGTILVHYDLPWSPNRVEQRTGRLDRFGVATPVASAVLLATGDTLAAGWADYLDRGYAVFERSVAALQYLTEAELAALYPLVLTDGLAALAAAARRLGGSEGEVARALTDIQVLDELDAVEVPPGHEHFAGTLRETDVLRRGEWLDATHAWVTEGLRFVRAGEGNADSGVWRYRFCRPIGPGGSTLMPVGRLVRQFSHVIDRDDERSTPSEPLTYPLSFDRARAQRERVALARLGDPFFDALADYVQWDDRGAVSAMWRLRPNGRYAHPAEVAYLFEFVVECPTAGAVELTGEDASSALRRQADWLFPPFAISVWLDENLDPIAPDSSKFAVLSEPYTKANRKGVGDFNLNAERWAALAAHFPRGDWTRQVERARAVAEQTVRASAQWVNEIATRLAAARRDCADRDAQTASRLAFLTGGQHDEEAEHAEHALQARAVAEALLGGISNPTVRLDAAGAVFLANWNPFTDLDE